MKRIAPSDFKEMPWRNGGGVTAEIARQDDADGLLWRVSTARVDTDCDYSLFPGLLRWSAVVEGKGVRLTNTKSQEVSAVTPTNITKLSGDVLYRGALIDGGFRHLNLVFDPERVSAKMAYVGVEVVELSEDSTHLIYCCSGRIADWNDLPAFKGDVLMTEEAETLYPDEGSTAILISVALTP